MVHQIAGFNLDLFDNAVGLRLDFDLGDRLDLAGGDHALGDVTRLDGLRELGGVYLVRFGVRKAEDRSHEHDEHENGRALEGTRPD